MKKKELVHSLFPYTDTADSEFNFSFNKQNDFLWDEIEEIN